MLRRGTTRAPTVAASTRRDRVRDTLPDAALVIDHFHAIRLASEAVNDVRRRVQQTTTGHRGRKGDPLYGIRRLLLMTWANLNDKGWDRLRAGLAAGDPDGEIAAVWLARELLSEVYRRFGSEGGMRVLV